MKLYTLLAATACTLSVACTTYPSISHSESEAVWQGTWRSKQLPLIHGTLSAVLPNTIPVDEEFKVPTKIRYSKWGFFRRGQVVDATFAGLQSKSRQVGGSNGDTPRARRRPVYTSFKMKGRISGSKQTISYDGNFTEQMDSISGRYYSQSPYDKGVFTLSIKEPKDDQLKAK